MNKFLNNFGVLSIGNMIGFMITGKDVAYLALVLVFSGTFIAAIIITLVKSRENSQP